MYPVSIGEVYYEIQILMNEQTGQRLYNYKPTGILQYSRMKKATVNETIRKTAV